jgi:phage portal protein BeeE
LELPKPYGTEFDLDDLLRMDSKTMMDVIARGVQSAIYSPNEGRLKVNLKPTPGGETPYLQVQNYSLEALAQRDKAAGAPDSPTITVTDAADDEPDEPNPDDEGDDDTIDEKAFGSALLARARYLAVQHAG